MRTTRPARTSLIPLAYLSYLTMFLAVALTQQQQLLDFLTMAESCWRRWGGPVMGRGILHGLVGMLG